MNDNGKRGRVRIATWVATLGVLAAGGLVYLAGWGRAGADEEVGLRPRVANPAQAADEKAIRQASADLMKAFNAGDAKAVAAQWTPDGDFMDVQGEVYRGRDAIEKLYTTQFALAKGGKLEVTIDSIRFVGKDTALEKGTAHARPGAGRAAATTRFTAVRVKRDGKWLLESVHESPYQTGSNYEFLRDLEWMIGTWTGKPSGTVCEITCAWTANRNFMLCTHTTRKGDSVVATSTQVIGWDPTLGQVRSWDFDSEGGFGSELWHRDGERWVLEAHGVRRDGCTTEAVNIITPVDANTFTWQSVHRRVRGAELPDTEVVKAVRVAAKK
jgi:uncharacterized protein (TIGR02246 family)